MSKYPILAATVHPYSLNGTPIDVLDGDWFVGKAAASVLIAHPILGQVQIYNTHVSLPVMSMRNSSVVLTAKPSFMQKVVMKAQIITKPTVWSTLGSSQN